MLRRRRSLKNEAIHFSFDSFLDLVTNIVGIIIRLILATWIGARSYHATMQWIEVDPANQPQKAAPKAGDDPLHTRIEASKRDLDDAKTRLLAELKELEVDEEKTQITTAQLMSLVSRRTELEDESKKLDAKGASRGVQVKQTNVTIEEIRERSKKLLAEYKKLESMPSKRNQLKYHAPVSQVVRSEELFFECQNGRVSYIDLPAFMQEIKLSLEEVREEMKTKARVERTTPPVGPYRVRYAIERINSVVNRGSYGLSGYEVEPTTKERGETLQQALAAKSQFRQLTDGLDSRLTVVTFWVYPDSFELFRQLRDRLYEHGLDVAGRPLPPGAAIAGSVHGTASRGQ